VQQPGTDLGTHQPGRARCSDKRTSHGGRDSAQHRCPGTHYSGCGSARANRDWRGRKG